MRNSFILAALILTSAVLALPGSATAGGFEILTVNVMTDTFDGTCDAADCSLRDALSEANDNINETHINVPAGIIEISSAVEPDFEPFEIDTIITITGAGIDDTTINGGQIATVFKVTQEGDGTLVNLGITEGVGQLTGGILALGPVKLDTVRVFANANTGMGAAGISAFGDVTMQDSFVTDNLSPNGNGGLQLRTGTIRRSVISDNASTSVETSVGGILSGGDVTIEDSTIAGNRAMSKSGAGGILHSGQQFIPLGGDPVDPNTLTLRRVTISSNEFTSTGADGSGFGKAAGIVSSGELLATDVDITSNIMSEDPPSGGVGSGIVAGGLLFTGDQQLVINRGAITSNESHTGAGGAVIATGFRANAVPAGGVETPLPRMTNVTISGNETLQGAGGLLAFGGLEIVAATIANNTGGGGFQGIDFGGGILVNEETAMVGAIITDNEPMNCGGFIGLDSDPTSLGYNIDSRQSCGFDQSTDRQDTDPLLTPLHDNGGDAGDTHRLQLDSEAIDAWLDCPPPGLDQRREGRSNGAACDIGSYELAEDDDFLGVLWGDHNCSGTVGQADVLLTLHHEAERLRVTQAAPAAVPQGGGRECPDLTWEVAADGFAGVAYWGDINCNGDVTTNDILHLLYDMAGLMFSREPGCPAVEEQITLR